MEFGILQPGRNVWRVEHAPRAAVLVDGAAFFGAVREAFLNARRSIFIVGWDIDSRTRLVGEQAPADGYPLVLSEFLSELVRTRPELEVYILLWDYSVVYAAERELFPRLSLQWQTPSRVTLCMDDAVPFGSSQHQKLIVVDDALAFSGGLDLTQRRWDTSAHVPHSSARVDASEQAYSPFHDVQMMVNGDAAHALARLARRRWCRADAAEPPFAPFGDPWPRSIAPDFFNVRVGIARTEPAYNGQGKVAEVEALFFDSIAAAQKSIYIENQFMTSLDVAHSLARRLRERPRLELVTVCPRNYTSWVVSTTLGNRRGDFMRIVRDAGGDRVRMTYPCVADGNVLVETMVHSKVMIVDDRFLRVGSANLNNRSQGTDTECDLIIEASSAAERSVIRRVRHRLLADHCGTDAALVEVAIDQHGSIVAAVDNLSTREHRLCPLELPESMDEISVVLEGFVDPKRPLDAAQMWQRIREKAQRMLRPGIAMGTALLLALVLTLIWQFTSVSEFVTLDHAKSLFSSVAESHWAAPLWVLGIFLAAGAIAFPVTLLIVATMATFGPWLGFLYALIGVLASAIVMYWIGVWVGSDALRAVLGKRWRRARLEINERGFLAVAAIRLLPVAPFTLVNLIAGACAVGFLDYVAGTMIGMLPGLLVASLLGHGIVTVFTDMSFINVMQLLLALVAWFSMAWIAQKLIGRLRKRSS